MAIADVAVGGRVTASKQNEIIAAVNAVGATQVTGLSVAFTGSAASMGTDGRVTFSSVTDLTVYGLSSAYDETVWRLSSSGNASTVLVQTTNSSGVANTSSVYDRTENVARNGGVTSSTSITQTSWTVLGFANTLIRLKVELSGLRDARPTTGFSWAGTHANPAVSNTANGLVLNNLSHRNSTGYFGLKFTFSDTQSGTLRVQGII